MVYVIPFIIDRNNHVEIYIETSEDNSNEFHILMKFTINLGGKSKRYQFYSYK